MTRMSKADVGKLAAAIAVKYTYSTGVKRSDVIRDVVRTHRLNLDDSIIVADLIMEALAKCAIPIAVPAIG